MTKTNVLVAIISILAIGCDLLDCEDFVEVSEPREKYAPQTDRLTAFTFNGDIAAVSEPSVSFAAEITKLCKGTDKNISTVIDLDEVGEAVVDEKLDVEAAGGQSNACSNGADIDIVVSDSVSLDLSSANGNISVSGLSSLATLETTNGHITADVLSAGLEGKATNGNIDCKIATLDENQKVALSSINGDVTLVLPADVSAAFVITAINGTVAIKGFDAVDYTLNELAQKTGAIGTGLALIDVQSTNGNITIIAG